MVANVVIIISIKKRKFVFFDKINFLEENINFNKFKINDFKVSF